MNPKEMALKSNSHKEEENMSKTKKQNLIKGKEMKKIKEKEEPSNEEQIASCENSLDLPENSNNITDEEQQKINAILQRYYKSNFPAEDVLASLQKQKLDNMDIQQIESEYLRLARLSLEAADPDKISLLKKNGIEYIRLLDGKRPIYMNKETQEISLKIEENQELSSSSCRVFNLFDGSKNNDQYKGLFKTITSYLKEHIVLKNEHDYYVLAAYTVLTYSYNLFPMLPYLKIKGKKGTGKTTVLRTLKNIVKNPQFASNLSTAALLRLGDEEEYTLLLDEAEMLKKRKGSNEEIFEILNSGYQKDGTVLRASGTENIKYKTYSPKIIASINSIADTIEDRGIIIETDQNNGKTLKDPDLSKVKASEIKKLIQEIVITKSSEIIENYQKGGNYGDIELKNRDKDRWNPLFALGITVSGLKNKVIAELANAYKNEAAVKQEVKRNSPEEYNRSLLKAIPAESIIDDSYEEFTICRADRLAKFFQDMDVDGVLRTKTGVTQFLKRQGAKVDRQRIEGRLTAIYKIPNALIS